jgi:hypothetical protein
LHGRAARSPPRSPAPAAPGHAAAERVQYHSDWRGPRDVEEHRWLHGSNAGPTKKERVAETARREARREARRVEAERGGTPGVVGRAARAALAPQRLLKVRSGGTPATAGNRPALAGSMTETTPVAAAQDADDDALLRLAAAVRATGYRFVTVTPATHARVNPRPGNAWARDLRACSGGAARSGPRSCRRGCST